MSAPTIVVHSSRVYQLQKAKHEWKQLWLSLEDNGKLSLKRKDAYQLKWTVDLQKVIKFIKLDVPDDHMLKHVSHVHDETARHPFFIMLPVHVRKFRFFNLTVRFELCCKKFNLQVNRIVLAAENEHISSSNEDSNHGTDHNESREDHGHEHEHDHHNKHHYHHFPHLFHHHHRMHLKRFALMNREDLMLWLNALASVVHARHIFKSVYDKFR